MGDGRGRARGGAGDESPRARAGLDARTARPVADGRVARVGRPDGTGRAPDREAPRGDRGARAPLAGEDPEEYRACARKRRYATSVEARRAADQASRRKDAPRLYVYQCAYCGGWHLTHRRRQA